MTNIPEALERDRGIPGGGGEGRAIGALVFLDGYINNFRRLMMGELTLALVVVGDGALVVVVVVYGGAGLQILWTCGYKVSFMNLY